MKFIIILKRKEAFSTTSLNVETAAFTLVVGVEKVFILLLDLLRVQLLHV